MGTRMRRKLIQFLLKVLAKVTPQESLDEIYNENLETIITKSFKVTEDPKLLERRIAEIIFDAKYKKEVKSGVPHEILNSYYAMASKGDSSYMTKPFFRLLRQLGDPEVRKLKYRLKRNQT